MCGVMGVHPHFGLHVEQPKDVRITLREIQNFGGGFHGVPVGGAGFPPYRAGVADELPGLLHDEPGQAHGLNLLDTTGAAALTELCDELRGQNIRLSLARVRDPVRERMRRIGVESTVGEERIFETIGDGVNAFQNQ